MMIEEPEDDLVIEEGDESKIWNEYKCKSLSFGKKHPANVVEPGSLAAVPLPKLTYPILDSLQKQCDEGTLSSLQLESIAYACQKHQQIIMPSGYRTGFFIGDSAGVGKGRQIAGIIFDNFVRGRNKHIWFSCSPDLHKDATRDLRDIGCTIPVIDGCQGLDKLSNKALGASTKTKRAVLFSTYSTLVSSNLKNENFRYEQLVRWLCSEEGVDKENFDGCLIFDECHKAKNFSESETEGSKVSKMVLQLQKDLPKARCVYVSATGVTDISNMAYMERLGLWGKEGAFISFDDFKTSMGKRNLGALEMLAMELKATGMHVSRGLSYQDATFEIIKSDISESDREMYLGACEFWLQLENDFKEAMVLCRVDKKHGWGVFWSAHQRFFRQLCIASKINKIQTIAKEALENGKSVVIGLQTTGESATDYWSKNFTPQQKQTVPVCFTNNINLIQLIENHFPKVKLKAGETLGENSQSIVDQVEALKKKCLERALGLKLPPSPIDDLMYRLGGPKNVAELTGRATRILLKNQTGNNDEDTDLKVRTMIMEQRGGGGGADTTNIAQLSEFCVLTSRLGEEYGSQDSINTQEKTAFMNGEKRIAIISEAASTGISLHADCRAKNQQRRVHITCELPWAADAAIQQLGRTHRANAASSPEYKLLTSGIGGENRFVAAVASKLQSLGALTHGDRRASGGGLSLVDFNFNTHYGKQALKSMFTATIKQRVVNDIDWKMVIKRTSEVDEIKNFDETQQQQSNDPPSFWVGNKPIASEIDFIAAVNMGFHGFSDSKPSPQVMRGAICNLGVIRTKEKEFQNVTKFLNRILGLPIHLQALLFNYFSLTLDTIIKEAKVQGIFDEGVSDLHANSIKCLKDEPEVLYVNKSTGGELVCHELQLDRGISFDEAMDIFQKAVKREHVKREEKNEEGNNTNNNDMDLEKPLEESMLRDLSNKYRVGGFFESRNALVTTYYLLAIKRKGNSYVIYRPNTGRASAEMQEMDLNRKYKLIPKLETAKILWNNLFTSSATTCMHGLNCKNAYCTSGMRFQNVNILSGCVVPLWGEFLSSLRDPLLDLKKSEQFLRITRAQLDDHERIIGILWPQRAMHVLKKKIDCLNLELKEVPFLVSQQIHTVFGLGFELDPPSGKVITVSANGVRLGIQVGDILCKVDELKLPVGTTNLELVRLINRKQKEKPFCCIMLTFRTEKTTDSATLQSATGRLHFEPIQPVDEKCVKFAMKQPTTLRNFFSSSTKQTSSSSSNTKIVESKPAIVESKLVDLETTKNKRSFQSLNDSTTKETRTTVTTTTTLLFSSTSTHTKKKRKTKKPTSKQMFQNFFKPNQNQNQKKNDGTQKSPVEIIEL